MALSASALGTVFRLAVISAFMVNCAVEQIASAQSSLSEEQQAWLNETCPASFGPGLRKSCLDRNTPAVLSQPNLNRFSAADQSWLNETCPKSFGPSLRKSCLERNASALGGSVELSSAYPAGRLGSIDAEDSHTTEPKSASTPLGPNGTGPALEEERQRVSAQEQQAQARQKELTVSAQQGLAALGYYDDHIDGIGGPRTIRAIKQFQADAGLSIDGRVTADIVVAIGVAIGMGVKAAPNPKREAPRIGGSTGTGFVVSKQGHILTNAHVVDGCRTIFLSNTKDRLTLVSQDNKSDLALLKSSKLGKNFARFRAKSSAELGEDIVVIGYPLQGILSSGATVTKGSVSALAGLNDDRQYFQISAPIQPGNSGGPVIDEAGNVVGVVVAKLSETEIYDMIGDLPQNVNFAISMATVRSFLRLNALSIETGPKTKRSTSDIASEADRYTVPITCD